MSPLLSHYHTTSFLTSDVWVCPIQTNFLSPPGHPTNNSVRHYLSGLGGRSYKLRVQSHRTAPISDANCKSQFATCASEWLAINWGSYNPILGFGNLLEWLTELRETHLLVCYKEYNKTYRWKIRWRNLYRVRSGRVPSTVGAPGPVELGVHHPLGHIYVLRKLFEPHNFGIFREVSSHRHDWLTPFLVPLPFQRMGNWSESAKLYPSNGFV